jgi:hypothetical protein
MSQPVAKCPFQFPGLFDAGYVQDPYPWLARARAEAPIFQIEGMGLWLVTRHEEIRQVLLDPQTYSNTNTQGSVSALCPEAQQVLKERNFAPRPGLSGIDPPAHTRIRKHFSKVVSFPPRRMAELRPWIRQQASSLIDEFAARGRADLCATLTTPLPARVIFRLIGFPDGDADMLLDWCMARLKMSFGSPKVEEQVAMAEKVANYWNYCVDFVGHCEAQPGDNLAGELVRMSLADPESITRDEIINGIYGLIFAGQETTNHGIASALRLLLEDRSRWNALLSNRDLIPNAFEECLRLEPPIVAWRRITTRDTELGGVALPKGSELLLHLGSAGHDAALFEDGEHFSGDRANANAHLAFGHGIHFCLGAGLARAEGQIVVDLLLDRFPDLRLVSNQDYAYVPNLAFRGPTQLLVEWAVC